MDALDGKIAVVTGGAGGIGSATVHHLGARGASVVVVDVDTDAIDRIVEEVAATGVPVRGFRADVADADSVRDMITFALASWGRLDILVNNAAANEIVGRDSGVVDVDLATWDRTLAVNLTGPMLGCRYAVPAMLDSGGGAIINISSVAGLLAEREHVGYGVSKAGLVLLTKHVAVRYGKLGVRCNAIAPGVVVTERARSRRGAAWLDGMARIHHSPRLGDPADIAGAVGFLASDAAAFVNGAVLTVDGAMTSLLPGLDALLTDAEPDAAP